MTDPRTGPAGSPGEGGGYTPPESGGPPSTYGPSSAGQETPSQGSPGQSSTGQSGAGATGASSTTSGGVGTTTRGTPGTSVPQQQSRSTEQQRAPGYDYQSAAAASTPSATMLVRAAKLGWGLLLLCAAGMIALGICLLVWPHATLFVAAILVGASLIVSGIVKLWEGFTSRDRSGAARAGYIAIGLLAVLAGIYCLRHHALSVFLIAFVAGVYFVAHGISDLGVAFSTDMPGRGLRAVLGIFSIAAGLVLVIWPGLSLTLLLLIVGAWLLFYGCVVGALAFGVRKAGKEMSRQEMSTTQAVPV